jgi:Mg2+ and Co2+ transporter CorA
MPYSNTVIRDYIALANDKNGQASDFDGELLQSATFIPQEFSKHIDHNVASRNPFYAMDGIFRTFAASEQQFINLMADLIDNIASKGPEEGVMIELQHIYRCLQRHEERLQDTFEVLRGKGGRGWFRLDATTDSRKHKADDALQDLMHIFEKLLRRVSTVSTACKGEMEMLKHEAMFEETQKTIAQAEGLSKITAIAFVFVPLSFVTSFFGMNFPEIGESHLSLWIFFAVAAPVLCLSILAWRPSGSTAWKYLMDLVPNLLERRRVHILRKSMAAI